MAECICYAIVLFSPQSYLTVTGILLRMLGKMEAPHPPEQIPNYLADGLDRQDEETLAAIEACTRGRREYLDALADDLNEDELADEDEDLVDTKNSSKGTVVIKKSPCRKDCGGYPHGPYRYIVSREGDSLNWEYNGAVEQ